MLNFDEILLELSYRVESGIVDLTKNEQVELLSEILKERGISNANEISQKAKVYFSYLAEAKPNWQLAARVKKKDGKAGKVVYFQSQDAKRDAIKTGSHIAVDKNLKPEKPARGSGKVTGTPIYKGGAPIYPKADKSKKSSSEDTNDYRPTTGQIKTFKGRKRALIDKKAHGRRNP